jgi:histidinol-phosphatase
MSDLELALALADLADARSLPRFRSLDLAVHTKPDLTPVTDADRAVEEALRERLEVERPGDAVLGEEYGSSGDGPRRWIVDPIDGTKNFSRGLPIWATLIALEDNGTLALGVVSAPALGRRWWAARGEGAFANGEPMRVSRVARLDEASVSAHYDAPIPGVWHGRALGDFWQHMLVAEGALDAAVDPGLSLWDVAALVPIVEEAGGRITSVDGGDPVAGGSAVSSNGALHAAVLAALR